MTSPPTPASTDLRDLLHKAVKEAKIDITPAMQNASGATLCNADQLRAFLGHDAWRWRSSTLFSISLPSDLADALVDSIRATLPTHIADGRMGMGLLMYLKGVSAWRPPVAEFALDCVRAAVFLGPGRVLDLLSSWEQGVPIPYRCIVLLGDITVDETMRLDFGTHGGVVLFEKLPLSTDQVRRILPPMSQMSTSLSDLLGAVKMTCTHAAKSSTFQDPKGQVQSPSIDEWDEVSSPYRAIDDLIHALSIACNTHVSFTRSWAESADWRAFGGDAQRLEIYSSTGSGGRPRTTITQAHLNVVRDLLPKWPQVAENSKLGLAIARWVKSKRQAGLADQLIELRIALEALYLDRGFQGESTFRVSTLVAWHLGKNLQERLAHQLTIRDVYRLASRVIHGDVVKLVPDNRQLLTQAQDLCRAGILKVLHDDGRIPNWRAVALGSEALPRSE